MITFMKRKERDTTIGMTPYGNSVGVRRKREIDRHQGGSFKRLGISVFVGERKKKKRNGETD